jgi:iron complex transport system ATP-binding protein
MEVQKLRFAYNGCGDILKGVDMAAEEGDVLTLIGPNGSGKSTLIKCLAGILRYREGKALLGGRDLRGIGGRERAKMIGYVPQSESRGFPATVTDTVLMGRKPHISWAPTNKDMDIVMGIIEMMGLEELALRDVNKLSWGQRQKVMIGRALAQEPEFLLLDEPTSNLDLRHQLEVLNIVRRQAKEGVTSIMAIHDLNMVGRFCDRIVMLNDGEVHSSGGHEVICEENIESVYGVRCSIDDLNGWRRVTPESIV